MIDLLLASEIPGPLKAALADRYRLVHEAGPTVRAIVGGGMSVIDQALIDRLPALEIIAIHGVGHDGIDLAAANRAAFALR